MPGLAQLDQLQDREHAEQAQERQHRGVAFAGQQDALVAGQRWHAQQHRTDAADQDQVEVDDLGAVAVRLQRGIAGVFEFQLEDLVAVEERVGRLGRGHGAS